MPSLAQIEANRRNAQRSTGPRTPEGKFVSRFNALKTGIDAHSQVIRGEDSAALEVLTLEYFERYQPATPEQRCLVDILISSEWLLRRFRTAEADFWEFEARRTESAIRSNDHEIGRALHHGDEVLARLQRRIDCVTRNFHRALKELRELQSAAAPEPAPGPQLLETRPVTPELGSFLQADPQVPGPQPTPPPRACLSDEIPDQSC